VALPPLNAHLAADLVLRSGLQRLLGGYRGQPAADLQALHASLLRLSQLAADVPDVVELDINPLLVDAHGVLALDARARLRPEGQAPASLAIRPYPAQLEETVSWKGGALLLRPIRPEDGERLAQFYAHASPSDLRLRFFSARREVPASELARFSQIDYDREMAFIALPTPDPDAPMLGEARGLCDPDNQRAEFAIQVAGEQQGRGLGRLLLQKLIAYLRARGTRELTGECLVDNLRLQQLARDLDFDVTASAEGGILSLRLALNP
jgi:acetyltransferase